MIDKFGSILAYALQDYSLKALSYEEGKIRTIDYNNEDKMKVVGICLIVWENILKWIQMLRKRASINSKLIHKQVFNIEFMRHSNVADILSQIISRFSEVSILNRVCFIILELQSLCPAGYNLIITSDVKFVKLLNDCMVKVVESNDKVYLVKNVIALACENFVLMKKAWASSK